MKRLTSDHLSGILGELPPHSTASHEVTRRKCSTIVEHVYHYPLREAELRIRILQLDGLPILPPSEQDVFDSEPINVGERKPAVQERNSCKKPKPDDLPSLVLWKFKLNHHPCFESVVVSGMPIIYPKRTLS